MFFPSLSLSHFHIAMVDPLRDYCNVSSRGSLYFTSYFPFDYVGFRFFTPDKISTATCSTGDNRKALGNIRFFHQRLMAIMKSTDKPIRGFRHSSRGYVWPYHLCVCACSTFRARPYWASYIRYKCTQ